MCVRLRGQNESELCLSILSLCFKWIDGLKKNGFNVNIVETVCCTKVSHLADIEVKGLNYYVCLLPYGQQISGLIFVH